MKFATKAIHAGHGPDPETGAIMPPIYMTSTFLRKPQGEEGYSYTRAGNPNFTILEKICASLEEGSYATVFSSGLGALTAMVTSLKPGDHVVAIDGVYGGTYRLFHQVFQNFGIRFITLPIPKTLDEVDKALAEKPKWLLFETPTNPLLEIFDIEALATLAKKHGVTTIVDNTFASPYFQNPLKLGADLVWHSSTKYIGGHSDIIGGVVITNSAEKKKDLDFKRFSLGLIPSPFDVWLTTRGIKTLAVRMEQHQKNALAIAQFLEKQPQVKRVYYPGLESHRGHAIAKKQMSGYSGMVSVEFNFGWEKIQRLLHTFRYFPLAESLGGVESLVNHPATMTHAAVPKEEREKIGITDHLIRLSVGIEDTDDLINDLAESIAQV